MVSLVVVVFVIVNIPPTYDAVKQQPEKVEIDPKQRLDMLYENVQLCKNEKNPRFIAECEYPIKNEITTIEFKQKSDIFQVGPITYYYSGGEVDVSKHGMAVFNLNILAENTGSSDVVLLHCSGIASCNYHVWDGETKFTFSAHDFTAGNVGIKPGEARFFNMLFGPGQGYGNNVDFEYDPSKEYFLLIEESFGRADIPLQLVPKIID